MVYIQSENEATHLNPSHISPINTILFHDALITPDRNGVILRAQIGAGRFAPALPLPAADDGVIGFDQLFGPAHLPRPVVIAAILPSLLPLCKPSSCRNLPSPSLVNRCRSLAEINFPLPSLPKTLRIFVLHSVRIAHFREDFLPRIARITRMGNSSSLIRVIRVIRGSTALVAAGRAAICAFFAANLTESCQNLLSLNDLPLDQIAIDQTSQ
jgi:hypothetical protein